MATLVNNQPFTIALGASEVGPLDLPDGMQRLLVTYNCAAWPVAAAGTIAIKLRVAPDGVNYRDEWTDTIQYAQLSRGGVPQATAQFGITLHEPFGPTARLKVVFDSTVAVATTVTVEAA